MLNLSSSLLAISGAIPLTLITQASYSIVNSIVSSSLVIKSSHFYLILNNNLLEIIYLKGSYKNESKLNK